MMSIQQSWMYGMRASKGFFISTFLFGIMFGIAASSAGVSFWHSMFMSAAVFSASAQFSSLEFWQSPLPLGTIALSVFLVSTRNILLGMSMAHHFDGHTVIRRAIWLFALNDPGVVTALRLDKKVDRLGYVTGYGMSLMISWLCSTWVGLMIAKQFADTNLDHMGFAGPMVIATMMVLFAKGSKTNPVPWIVSGITALILHEFDIVIYLILPIAVLFGVLASMLFVKSDRSE